ncbi:MAG: hypothetical protein H6622_04985 [Halobacteriovoraceae bacterium]|nr:hypothetical protein [Halobacteriovoraceae bacterium]
MKTALFLTLLSFSTFAAGEKIEIYVDGLQPTDTINLTQKDKMILEDAGVYMNFAIYADGGPVPVDAIYADGDMVPDIAQKIDEQCELYQVEDKISLCQVNKKVMIGLDPFDYKDIYGDGGQTAYCIKCDYPLF